MMLQEKHLIRWPVQSDWAIREDPRLIRWPGKELDAIAFPRANIEDAPYDFSFSGLKSAVLNYINGCRMKGEEYNQGGYRSFFPESSYRCTGCESYACGEYKVDKFAIAGGVASNSALSVQL